MFNNKDVDAFLERKIRAEHEELRRQTRIRHRRAWAEMYAELANTRDQEERELAELHREIAERQSTGQPKLKAGTRGGTIRNLKPGGNRDPVNDKLFNVVEKDLKARGTTIEKAPDNVIEMIVNKVFEGKDKKRKKAIKARIRRMCYTSNRA
jgi:hypothetical protein